MTIGEISQITHASADIRQDEAIAHLITDSRMPFISHQSLFIAIKGPHHDGHAYIATMHERGVRNFLVEQPVQIADSNVLVVKDSIAALQQIAARQRSKFDIPVIGITGSNAKTIVKEWLYTCLAPKLQIVRSPKSYNSQIGVPLSIWQIQPTDELGIFEAGISKPGEMEKLAEMISPTIGLFTNIGTAHDEGFSSRDEKVIEKARLFKEAQTVVYCADHPVNFGDKSFTWGRLSSADLHIADAQSDGQETTLFIHTNKQNFHVVFPFADRASIENAMHCVAVMWLLTCDVKYIQQAVSRLDRLPMRLALKPAIGNSYVIDDSYSNDIGGLQQALNFFALQNQREKRVVILSDIAEAGPNKRELYESVGKMLDSTSISVLVGVGQDIQQVERYYHGTSLLFENTAELLEAMPFDAIRNAIILVKGARKYAFEKVTKRLEAKVHGTVLEINLDALTHNLNFYRSKLATGTKLMVMVKAFGYGSGSQEIANLLQFHRVDYLGVAYADEGVHLRENGIHLPIMVMNPNEATFDAMLAFNLEPEMYDLIQLRGFLQFLNGREAKIHLKLETGMKRLGFEFSELDELTQVLKKHKNVRVASVFSHLAGADERVHDQFSQQQAQLYEQGYQLVAGSLGYKPIRHLVNSPGIIRFPQYHYDMVRLGIGLYGMEAANQDQKKLLPISSLKTVVSQVKKLSSGQSVGYSRKGIADKDMTIATIAIGYADGYSRAFSRGVGKVMIQGKPAAVVGNVCMDMTMVDVTGMDVKAGDEVEIFGEHQSIKDLAEQIGTIPYEILTNVSQRVKRIYHSAG